jgi:uncharacterized protein
MNIPVILAITDHVPLVDKDRYEQMVDELHELFQSQEGFLSVDIVRYNRPHQVEYTVLLRWSNAATATRWKTNKAIQEKLSQIEKITGGTAQSVEAAGLGLWIDHAEGTVAFLPPFWKRVVMSVIAVYPTLLLLLALSNPVIGELSQSLQILIVVVLLSTLLTWPIMPWLTGILRSWLTAK